MSPPVRIAYAPELKETLREAERAYRRRDDAAVEQALSRAVEMAPHRLDIRFNLAGRSIQAGEIDRALSRYAAILALAPDDVDALGYFAHWSRFLGNRSAADAALAALRRLRPDRAENLSRMWRDIARDETLAVDNAIPSEWTDFAIVVFGYVLNPDGSMHDILLKRLEKTLEAARAFPQASVIVTGGVPMAGRVEAVEIRDWLVANGVAADRIIEEGYARDVVENCLYTLQIMEICRFTRLLIVTSAIDVRRARLAMGTAAWTNGHPCAIKAVACESDVSNYHDTTPTKIKIHRDILRAHGMPMMRVFPEMVEL